MNLLWHMIDNACLHYLYLVNTGRNLCDLFINKNAFIIKDITIYLANCQQYSVPIVSESCYHQNIKSFLSNHNFNVDYWMEIIYHLGENRYRAIYHNQVIIPFPPYTLDEIQPSNAFHLEIIYAEYHGADVTSLLKEYAGPKGNFYCDKGLYITLNHISGLTKTPGAALLLTDNNADDYSFKADKRIMLTPTLLD